MPKLDRTTTQARIDHDIYRMVAHIATLERRNIVDQISILVEKGLEADGYDITQLLAEIDRAEANA